MNAAVRAIARVEFVAAARQRWVRLFTAAFALLAGGMAWSSGAVAELGGPEGFARTTVALVPLVIALVPLAALLLGISGHAGEPGGEAFLFAQPVTRFEVLLGRWLGQTAALATALGLGFGAGALYLTILIGPAGLPGYLRFTGIAMLLGAAFLALAAALAAGIARRAAALGTAAFVWFASVLLYDALALSAAGWLTGRAGGKALMLSVLGNPADLARVLALSTSGTPHVLGAAGDAWQRLLGGPAAATGIALLGLGLWIVLPLLAARWFIARRDL